MDAIGRTTLAGMVALAIGLSMTAHLIVGASLLSVTMPLIAATAFYLMVMMQAIRCIAARRRSRRTSFLS
ncbi:hypothetical protein O9X98_07040 [Agrobacterium salinitolerans]|nr:hypothetical protein [Agrobacterium salinitolerans]